MHPKVGEIDSNVKKSLTMIEEASKNGANLIVLPELANSGYVFNSREEAFKLSEEIPGGKTSKAWMDSAKKNNVYIVAGINERDDNLLYNSSVIIGPTGYIGTFRKVHLWNEENLFFEFQIDFQFSKHLLAELAVIYVMIVGFQKVLD